MHASFRQRTGVADLHNPSYLLEWQQHELLGLGHLHEVLQDVFVGRLEQVAARVRVGEPPDAEAVGGVQLTEQELAARVAHAVKLQQAGRREQRLGGQKQRQRESVETKQRGDTGGPAAFSGPVPARCLPPPRSLLCRRTGPAAPVPEGRCRGGSHGSADSLTSHLHRPRKDKEPSCDFISEVVALRLPPPCSQNSVSLPNISNLCVFYLFGRSNCRCKVIMDTKRAFILLNIFSICLTNLLQSSKDYFILT